MAHRIDPDTWYSLPSILQREAERNSEVGRSVSAMQTKLAEQTDAIAHLRRALQARDAEVAELVEALRESRLAVRQLNETHRCHELLVRIDAMLAKHKETP